MCCCCCPVAQSCLTLCDPMDCSTPGLPVPHCLLEFTQVHAYWISDAIQPLIFCHPLLLLPSIFPRIRVFSNESAVHIRWPKYWSFSFSISPSNECSGLISFRIDWFDLLAVQGTLKSLLQYHSSKTSILQHSAFFMIQLSHPYETTGKPIAVTIWVFVIKVMSSPFSTPGHMMSEWVSPRTWGLWNLFLVDVLPCYSQDYHKTDDLTQDSTGQDKEFVKEDMLSLQKWHKRGIIPLATWRGNCPASSWRQHHVHPL